MEIGTGVMWYDAKVKSLDDLVKGAAKLHQVKYGSVATVALVCDRDLAGECMVGEITVRGVPYIQRHHALAGREGLL